MLISQATTHRIFQARKALNRATASKSNDDMVASICAFSDICPELQDLTFSTSFGNSGFAECRVNLATLHLQAFHLWSLHLSSISMPFHPSRFYLSIFCSSTKIKGSADRWNNWVSRNLIKTKQGGECGFNRSSFLKKIIWQRKKGTITLIL